MKNVRAEIQQGKVKKISRRWSEALSPKKGRSVGFALVFIFLTAVSCTRSKNDIPNTLRIASQAKVKGIDPIYADDQYSGNESSRVYEGLLQYHYLKRPYVLVPNLADAMPKVEDAGATYTFKLKQGVLFHDDPAFKETQGKGRELTANDVVYSFMRLADPKNASPGWWVLDGKIKGLNDWREQASKAGKADYARPVEGLKPIDRYTLQIKLTAPSAQFLYALAMPLTGVVPREAVEAYGKEFINHGVGTGPFRLKEFNGNSKMVYLRNPTYRKEVYPTEGEASDRASGLLEDAGKPIPFVDQVVVQVMEESQPRWLNFLSGKLDYSVIPKDNFQQAMAPTGKDVSDELKSKNIRLIVSPGLDITHTSFNMADPLLGKNKLLRQALSVAYDDVPAIELFYNGRALAAQGPIPPGIEGYDSTFKNPYRQFNLAKAKELLAKAGFPEGKGLEPLEYATLSDSTSRQMNEYAQKAFGAIGVRLKINTYSWPEFQAAVKNKRGQIWSFAWGADYPDAENFLQLFYSKNVSPGPNDSNYSNPEFDRLYEQALKLQDSPARTALYKKMVALVVEDCPWIFGVHRLGYMLTQPWLKNMKAHDFDHAMAKYLRVDFAARK